MSLTRIDLNLLAILDAVLAERSVARAAERLNVTPSAVSNSLARLRLELRDPLVVRNGRGVVPTPRAQELAPTLKAALESLKGIVREERFDCKTTRREFTVAMADAGQLAQLPRLSQLIACEMPQARVKAIGIDTYVAWGGPSAPNIDAAIARFNEDLPGVHAIPLYKERGALVARAGHPNVRSRLTATTLKSLRHVEIEVAPGRGFKELDTVYAKLGIQRSIAVTVPSFVAAASIVATTDWVATLPLSLVDAFSTQFDLQPFKGVAPTPETPLSLIWHERTHNDPGARAFREILQRVFH